MFTIYLEYNFATNDRSSRTNPFSAS